MRALLIIGFFITAPLCGATDNAELPEGPKINVLLEKDANSAFLEVKGHYRVIQKDSGSTLSSGSVGKRYVVHALQDGLRWGEEYPDVYQISIIPTQADTFVYVNGMQYKGSVSVYHVRDNKITIVNEVPIEDYLKSTLSIRFDAPLNREALSALIIAARTEAYSRVVYGKTSSCPWEVTAQEAGYYGCGVIKQRKGVEEAIDWTRFMVVESPKHGGPSQNIHLVQSEAEELAMLGMDAKKILKTLFPSERLGITIDAAEVALR